MVTTTLQELLYSSNYFILPCFAFFVALPVTVCPMCPASFSQFEQLKQHLKTHSGKPYQCSVKSAMLPSGSASGADSDTMERGMVPSGSHSGTGDTEPKYQTVTLAGNLTICMIWKEIQYCSCSSCLLRLSVDYLA